MNRWSPAKVRVDVIGLGSGVADRLRQMQVRGVEDINVSRRAWDPKLYMNQRSEMAFALRQALERGDITLPDDPELLGELASIRYDFAPSGALRLEDKKETKKRLMHSPDRFDAAMMGFVGGRMRRYRATAGVWCESGENEFRIGANAPSFEDEDYPPDTQTWWTPLT